MKKRNISIKKTCNQIDQFILKGKIYIHVTQGFMIIYCGKLSLFLLPFNKENDYTRTL